MSRQKLIIQIPCWNEERTLAITLRELPRRVPGFAKVEWLVVDDGSTDLTVEVARAHGVDHVLELKVHQGLARAFMEGLEHSLKLGADVIVTTDADNQYYAGDIPNLIRPILERRAELVIGARPIAQTRHFSFLKKSLQRLGSAIVRRMSGTLVRDAPSGFRAITREAALRMNIFSEYTYTLESILQAGAKGIPVVSVPIRTNADLRPSRLVRSISSYVRRSAVTLLKIFMTYQPMKTFLWISAVPITAGVLLGVRWLLLFYGKGHAQALPSLILASVLLLAGFQMCVFAFLAELLSVNRRLTEDVQLRVKRVELGMAQESDDRARMAG